jgi:hypothetical protein
MNRRMLVAGMVLGAAVPPMNLLTLAAAGNASSEAAAALEAMTSSTLRSFVLERSTSTKRSPRFTRSLLRPGKTQGISVTTSTVVSMTIGSSMSRSTGPRRRR